jgi:hypothetical protein
MPRPDSSWSFPAAEPSRDPARRSDERLPLLWPRSRQILGGVFAAVAVLVLQLALAAFYWIADPSASTMLAPTWDTGAIALLLVLFAALAGRGRPGWGNHLVVFGAGTLVFLYFLMGLGQGFARREFGYDVVLRLHIGYVPELFRMMYGAEPLGWFILYCALLALGTLAVVAAIYASVRHIVAFARKGRARQIGLAAGVAAGFALGAVFFGPAGPVSREAYAQLDMAINMDRRAVSAARKLELEAARPNAGNPFAGPGAARPTILVFVIESYGTVLWRDRDFSAFPTWLDEQGKALGRAGYHIASKQMVSPTFGGSSWLAGTSLLCGVRIDNQKRFQGLLASQVRCLPAFLNEAGYRTVVAAGNIKSQDESYQRILPFQKYYIRDDFAYRGPRMGWAFVPDQYAIDFIHRREIAPRLVGSAEASAARPLFAAYFLTTSHHPWSIVPPFVADWSSLGDGTLYGRLPITDFQNQFVAGNDYRTAYRSSIQYSLQSVLSYLQRLPPDDRSLVIVLGDHQPRRPVARMKEDPWTVPVHVLSRDPKAVERFARVGYRPGLAPALDQAPAGLEKFMPDLFAVYAAPAEKPAAPAGKTRPAEKPAEKPAAKSGRR